MSQTHTFNPLTIPIQGINLIEASAGTGKTYGIAALFARLVVLEDKQPKQLLVLTFSKAATAELKSRLRSRLHEILSLLQNSQDPPNDDVFLCDLFKQIKEQQKPIDTLILHLQAAINEFDNAGIHTIHGFCKSVLSDEAFLCNIPFEMETDNDQNRQLIQAAEDFWRKRVSYHPDFARLCFNKNIHPHKMLAEIRPFINQTDLSTHLIENATKDAETKWLETEKNLNTLWAQYQPTQSKPNAEIDSALSALASQSSKSTQTWIESTLIPQKKTHNTTADEMTFWEIYPTLNGNIYRLKTYTALFEKLAQMKAQNQPITLLPTENIVHLYKLLPEELTTNNKKNHQVDQDKISEISQLGILGENLAQLISQQEWAIDHLRLQMCKHIQKTLEQAKKHHNQRSFDDLLIDVRHALNDNPKSPLARAMADKWHVLLVDEFQDTDPTQYAIFKTAFAENQIPVFLVGDPKQAIYRFRGADIHTYLQAAKDAGENRFTLNVNYRSHQNLINVFAAIFSHPKPFIYEEITYTPITANRANSNLSCLPALSAFRLPEKSTDTDIATHCANHIATLLNEHTAEISNGDIAILVQSHTQAGIIAKALHQYGLRSVMIQRTSVFSSEEAQMLAALLRFWLNPQQSSLLRFVLAGSLFAYTAKEIDEINQDEAQMSQYWQWAAEALVRWQKNGIFSAWQYFSSQTKMEINLIARRAERTLTNINQLLEILAQQESTLFGIHALPVWLDQSIVHAKENKENNQLRLESDENLISIMTIHAAKGLQFPIVYCPFLDKKPYRPSSALSMVYYQQKNHLLSKQQMDQTITQSATEEEQSENLRLLYVALTRAREALMIFIEDYNGKPRSSLDYLLNIQDKQSHWQQWKTWEQKHEIDINWIEDTNTTNTVKPIGQISEHFQAATLTRTNFRAEYTTSFSALSTFNERAKEETLPIDTGEANSLPPETNNQTPSPFTFARGIRSGLCWHEILEQFNFQHSAQTQQTTIARILRKYQFDPEIWTTPLMPMFEALRNTKLHQNTALKDIPPHMRLSEIGFLLHKPPLANPHLRQKLAQTLPNNVAQSLCDFHFIGSQKWLNGFIDLTFIDQQNHVYIIDYKSNYLGATHEDYHPTALNNAMIEHHYAIQATIYAYAVQRHLRTRQMDNFPIHIRYLFLRGLQENSPNGIFSWDLHSSDFDNEQDQ